MKVVYGQRGQPVGSIDGDALYSVEGNQVAFLDEGIIYRLTDGQPIGSYAGGVVFNGHSAPQGFTQGCRKSLPIVQPRLGMLPPRLASIGDDVSTEKPVKVPAFLLEQSNGQPADAFRDGYFQ